MKDILEKLEADMKSMPRHSIMVDSGVLLYYYPLLRPMADCEELAVKGRRIILIHGKPTKIVITSMAQYNGWVIGVIDGFVP